MKICSTALLLLSLVAIIFPAHGMMRYLPADKQAFVLTTVTISALAGLGFAIQEIMKIGGVWCYIPYQKEKAFGPTDVWFVKKKNFSLQDITTYFTSYILPHTINGVIISVPLAAYLYSQQLPTPYVSPPAYANPLRMIISSLKVGAIAGVIEGGIKVTSEDTKRITSYAINRMVHAGLCAGLWVAITVAKHALYTMANTQPEHNSEAR